MVNVAGLVRKPKVFDRPERKNCVFKGGATVGINVHITSGEVVVRKHLSLYFILVIASPFSKALICFLDGFLFISVSPNSFVAFFVNYCSFPPFVPQETTFF